MDTEAGPSSSAGRPSVTSLNGVNLLKHRPSISGIEYKKGPQQWKWQNDRRVSAESANAGSPESGRKARESGSSCGSLSKLQKVQLVALGYAVLVGSSAIILAGLCTAMVDGGFSAWTTWSNCSATCDVGIQQRTRSCDNPTPANGGANCEGVTVETQTCNDGACPINGIFSDWSEWSDCSVTCGQGLEIRNRSCNNPATANGGEDCQGDAMETRSCDSGADCECQLYVIESVKNPDRIFSISPDGNTTIIPIETNQNPRGLAYDSLKKNFIWTELGGGNLENYTVVVQSDFTSYTLIDFPTRYRNHPYFIALDEEEELLFIGLTNYGIYRTYYNGSSPAVVTSKWFVNFNVRGVATDVIRKKVYWCDTLFDGTIEVADYTGFNHKVLVQGSGDHDVGVTPGQMIADQTSDKLFWILRNTAEIRSLSLSDPGDVTTEIPGWVGLSNVNTYSFAYCHGDFYISRDTDNQYIYKWNTETKKYNQFSDVAIRTYAQMAVVHL